MSHSAFGHEHGFKRTPSGVDVKRPRILLAEDDDELRWSLTDVLDRAGFEVFAVADGCAFLDIVSEAVDRGQPPAVHAIVTDVRMPGFHTFNILSGLHQLGGAPPVIVISAFGDEDLRARARSVGAVAFLDKPFNLQQLERTLREALGHISPR